MSQTELATIVKPKVLRAGDTVGIIAPSSPHFEESYLEFTFARLRQLGLKWKLSKHLYDHRGDLAGLDQSRLFDLHEMWSDPEVKAIFPVRGGRGADRLLDKIDYDLIAKNPKIIVGFSDITALLIALHQKTGLVTFHGPTARAFFDNAYTYESFVKALMVAQPLGKIHDPTVKDWNPEYPPTRVVLSEGSARGRLTGGCLTLIKELMGTPFEIDCRDRILFLEDYQEEPHNLDRMLTQLELAGKLDQAAGIIVGECAKCSPGESRRNTLALNFSVERMLRERLSHYKKPVIYGLRIGHSSLRCTLPVGAVASLVASPERVSLVVEESATVE
ncbi:MAG: LD-carboxypeptidase [Cyanobacteria bacterium]|nr:LD-carboxypeptidase [Cyanobacteriota bacterium]